MDGVMRIGRGFWVLALLWAAIIFTLSSIPGKSLPPLPDGMNADKLLHAAVYAVLGSTCFLAARNTWPARPWRIVLGCTLGVVAYGISDELHQSLVPGRSPDLMDVAADGVGGLSGTVLTALLFRFGKWQRPHVRAL